MSRWLLSVEIALVAVMTGHFGMANTSSTEPTLRDWTVGAIRECMAKAPPPWPKAWQEDYVTTIRDILDAHQDATEYARRLEILRDGFGAYWGRLRKGSDRFLFEVDRARIRWYTESLMDCQLIGPDERRKVGEQHAALLDYAAASLLAQFPFLDAYKVQSAKADLFVQWQREIEAPLLPTFRILLSEPQMNEIRERWHALRYARVDFWRQRGIAGPSEAAPDGSSGGNDFHYLLAQHSFLQLRGEISAAVDRPPDYCREAVSKEIEARKRDLESRAGAWKREVRLGEAVLQAERVSFLLASLLETARSAWPMNPQEVTPADRHGTEAGETEVLDSK